VVPEERAAARAARAARVARPVVVRPDEAGQVAVLQAAALQAAALQVEVPPAVQEADATRWRRRARRRHRYATAIRFTRIERRSDASYLTNRCFTSDA
jgi:hypothetical protein